LRKSRKRLEVALQFIEASSFGVRAAHYRLRSSAHSLEFHLFPMIHIASAEFYQEVRRRIERCDVVLFEGVRSLPVKILTTSYTWAARSKRLELVTQRDALRVADMKSRLRLVHADSSTQEFEAAWTLVPWYWRLAAMVGAPLYGTWLYLTASRESIGRRLGTEDLETHEDIERFDSVPQLEAAMVTKRDMRLVAAIASLIERPDGRGSAAVIYGAAHMRKVTRLLMAKYGYRVAEAEWLHVFQYAR
jgi:hypothetical protein